MNKITLYKLAKILFTEEQFNYWLEGCSQNNTRKHLRNSYSIDKAFDLIFDAYYDEDNLIITEVNYNVAKKLGLHVN